MRKSPSKTSLLGSQSTATLATSSSSTLTVDVKAEPLKYETLLVPDSAADFAPLQQARAANARLMERTPFAIDDAKDDEDESDDELGGEDGDDQVMDEVRFQLSHQM
jgi:hypothetical protein